MIKGFQTNQPLEPTGNGRLQWGAAIEAALIAGAVLLVVPRGSPWSSFTFFFATVMGRSIAPLGLNLGWAYLIHSSVPFLRGGDCDGGSETQKRTGGFHWGIDGVGFLPD